MSDLSQILSPSRTVCHASGGSKKRLFETIAKVLTDDQAALDYATVLDHLNARERLGSTGLGEGIALPHCRADSCTAPLGALITLDEPIAYDAPDDRPVDLLFVLLVPAEEHQQHLEILASVAKLFSESSFCTELRAAQDNQTLYQIASGA